MGNRQLFPGKSAIELLVEFRESGSQEPFEEIVRRYAAMVYGVCLRVTGDKHDAEDATQAVFLSLALQAKTSREIKYLGPWLQKVAHRLALDVKKSKTRRKRREDKLADQARHSSNGNGRSHGGGIFTGGNGHGGNPADAPGTTELKGILMEELNKLPPKYRMPLVMHYFGGLSREEMAEQLKCNPSTLGVRVHRGKALLGTRLAKRGIAISAISLAVMLEHVVRTGAVQPMLAATASSGAAGSLAFYAAQGNGATSAALQVLSICRIAARSVAYAKLKYAVMIALVIGSIAMTSTGAIARFVNLRNLHLPSIDLRQFIRPLLKTLFPSARADATLPNERPEEDHPLASGRPIPMRVDWDKLGLPQGSELIAPAPATSLASAQPVVVTSAAPAEQRQQPEESSLAQITRGFFDPPPLFRTIASSSHEKNDALGSGDDRQTADETKSHGRKPVMARVDDLLIGAGGGAVGGKPDVYTLPANSVLRTQSQIIGDQGFGIFRQTGGLNQIAGNLTLGRKKGGVGHYELSSGTLTAEREIIGDEGNGSFTQYGGTNIAEESIIIGNSGQGSYRQVGGETIVAKGLTAQDPSTDTRGLHLGEFTSGVGSYDLSDGTLTADPQLIGVSGIATFTQSGGLNTTGAIEIASKPGSKGQYTLAGGSIKVEVRTTNTPDASIKIGGEGKGVFNLGNGARTGSVYEIGKGGSVVVRGAAVGDGLLTGWGKLDLKGALVNNSQVVADGYRSPRTLDLSSFGWVTSSIENPRWGGTSGWFARREGKLTLPPIPVKAGRSTNTWGEDNGDPMIDLVNSVRFTVNNAKKDGNVSISLLSTLREDIPKLPEFNKFIGVWAFDGMELEGFDSIQLQVRYDDTLAKQMLIDENILKLWQYDSVAASWKRINDQSFIRDAIDHILTGTAGSSMTYFAVSAPEPGSALLLLIGGAALMRRRRNNH